jgi:hypothetical protein
MTSSVNEPTSRVQVLNLKTGTVSIEQVPLSQIVFPTKSVSQLTDSQISRLTRLYQKVGYVIDDTLAKWLEDFTYELHPEPEIQIWEEMAAVFEKYSKTHRLTFAHKREVLNRLLRLVKGEPLKDPVSLELFKLLNQERASKFFIRPYKSQAPWENIDYKLMAQIYTKYVERHQVGIHENKDDFLSL